jgi:hypothetical protein
MKQATIWAGLVLMIPLWLFSQTPQLPAEELWHVDLDSQAVSFGHSWIENGQRQFVVGRQSDLLVISDGQVTRQSPVLQGNIRGVARAPSFGADSLDILALIVRDNRAYLSRLSPQLDSVRIENFIDTIYAEHGIAAKLYTPLIGVLDSTQTVYCSIGSFVSWVEYMRNGPDTLFGYGDQASGFLYALQFADSVQVQKRNLFWSKWGEMLPPSQGVRTIPITGGTVKGTSPLPDPPHNGFFEMSYGNLFLETGPTIRDSARIQLEYYKRGNRMCNLEFYTGCVGATEAGRTTFYTSYLDSAGYALSRCSYPPLRVEVVLRENIKPFQTLVEIPASVGHDEYLLGFTPSDSVFLINTSRLAVIGIYGSWRDSVISAEFIESDEDDGFHLVLLDHSRLTLLKFDALKIIGSSDLPPSSFILQPCFPNPFNSTTTISFGLDKSAPTRLDVYGIDGRLVNELLNSRLPAGDHRVVWNAEGLPAGVYLIRLESAGQSIVRKAVLIR